MTSFLFQRRHALRLAASGLALAALGAVPAVAREARTVEVWKDPSCGCCKDWTAYLEGQGYQVTAHDAGRDAARVRLGLPQQYASCHTALIDGYVLEGHVGVPEIAGLLRERPQAVGLAVPGMPVGSPGMDGAVYAGRRDRYDTLLVLRDGSSRVFARHG